MQARRSKQRLEATPEAFVGSSRRLNQDHWCEIFGQQWNTAVSATSEATCESCITDAYLENVGSGIIDDSDECEAGAYSHVSAFTSRTIYLAYVAGKYLTFTGSLRAV